MTADETDDLDDEFPPGDGTADNSAMVRCPYCNQPVEIGLDPGGGASQRFVEDCEVCCQPWEVTVRYGNDGSAEVALTRLDE